MKRALRQVWRVIVLIIGCAIVLVGLVLFLTPGPAALVIPLGLAILASEFESPRRLLRMMRHEIRSFRERLHRDRGRAPFWRRFVRESAVSARMTWWAAIGRMRFDPTAEPKQRHWTKHYRIWRRRRRMEREARKAAEPIISGQ